MALTIGPYTVIRKLGQGDYGAVYEVERDGERHALKAARGSAAAIFRVRNEAAVLPQLDDPRIPGYVDAGEDGEDVYVVMDLVTGRTLADMIDERRALNGTFTDVETISVVSQLLGVLTHCVEAAEMVHRDIKSANVMVRPADLRVAVIDFGFAKRHGTTEVRADTFWGAGSSVYSPPAKLENPGYADASHDVYAVGALAYEMLTGGVPYFAPGGDISKLKEQFANPPSPIEFVHPRVRPEVVALISEMLELRDEHRPSATEMAERAVELQASLVPPLPGRASPRKPLVLSRVIRDPLHGDIRLTEFEWEILDAKEMQRLRSIRQLGFARLVYPGAEHSRLTHSLGTLFRVEQILRSIEETEGPRFDAETRITARLYGLVHDVTHVAFGHSIEDELGLFESHDHNADRIQRLLLGPDSEVGQLLLGNEAGRKVRTLFDPSSTIASRGAIEALVSGSTGADVLDYIDRDALHCGLQHRVDTALFRQLRLTGASGGGAARVVSLLYSRHGVRLDREYAVESLFRERFAMFMKVYTHPKKNAATAVLDKALHDATQPDGRKKRLITEPQLEWMSDDMLVHELATSQRQLIARCGEMLLRRRLPRAVYRARLLKEPVSHRTYEAVKQKYTDRGSLTPKGRRAIEAELAVAGKISAENVFVYLPRRPPGYKRLEHTVSDNPQQYGDRDDGHEPYLAVREAHLRLWEVWVYVADEDPQVQARIAGAARELFGRANLVDTPRRDNRLF